MIKFDSALFTATGIPTSQQTIHTTGACSLYNPFKTSGGDSVRDKHTDEMALPQGSSLPCPQHRDEWPRVMLYTAPPSCLLQNEEKPEEEKDEPPVLLNPNTRPPLPMPPYKKEDDMQQTKHFCFWKWLRRLFGQREDFNYNKHYK